MADGGPIEALKEEVRRLRVINDVLIRRVERETDPAGNSAFSLFYNTVTVDSNVTQRTTTLTNLARRLVQEVAERKEAEAALLDAKAAAERANESKTNFLAAISHDLRQPLHAARLYLGEAAAWAANGSAGGLIGRAEAALDAMDDMLESLLDMARLDSGSWRVEPKTFALAPLLARLVEESQAAAQEAGLRLRYVPSSAVVHTDRRLLEQILRNLIGNAMRYTVRGSVLVGCRNRRGSVRIDVVDSGAGIPRDQWDLIFQEFHQLGTPSRQPAKGLGLGLAVVDRAARLIGAALEVDSRPGRGSRFSVSLPRQAQDALFGAQPATAAAANGPVLLVEDNPEQRAAMTGLLEKWHCEVISVGCTGDALRELRQRGIVPRIIIMDEHAGNGAQGMVAVDDVRQFTGVRTPALLMTDDRAPAVRAAAQDAGIILMSEPVAPSKLRATVTYLLGQAETVPHRAGG
jgi:signal transduction histidine kinase/CheY-like chemotaxis protein